MLQQMNAPSSHLHDSTVGQVVHPQARHPLHITWWPSERHFAWIFLKKIWLIHQFWRSKSGKRQISNVENHANVYVLDELIFQSR